MNIKDELIVAVEENKQELIDLVCSLIQINTENPPGDTTEISRFIADYLGKDGIDVTWHQSNEQMYNLIASIGEEGGKELIYCGHTDVVPAGDRDKWSFDPFSGIVEDGWILGRGASDMKAGLGGLLFATALLKRMGVKLPGKLTLAIVPDEETGGEYGVPWLLERGLIKGDGCLIAEPSSRLHPTIGQKGSCWFKLDVYGEAGHGSLSPLAGRNAITDAIKAIAAIRTVFDIDVDIPEEVKPLLAVSRKYMEEVEVEREKYKEILEKISVNIGTIHGGTKSNVIPDTCTVEVDCRLPFGITQKEVYAYIEARLNELGIDYAITPFGFRSNANHTPATDPVCTAIINNISYVTKEEAYGVMQWASSDARHFRDHHIPVLQYGPAYLPSIHNFDEKVKVEDVVLCAKVYVAAVIDFLQQ
ncbi:ArgE/DapE family deacylase [Bacillus sp. FSL K6-6483]|uniref:M20 family metallopeptidase n=1 Tax=Shouchella rhizosphaerae TaxID=866786 RepID=UPI00203D1857|nr:ArgE/DapE family deacylase [Shouchella rhizosphaerae]MCM3379580.1 ArgE/DapE family deacylase [Shouchella rhizosphaerae]